MCQQLLKTSFRNHHTTSQEANKVCNSKSNFKGILATPGLIKGNLVVNTLIKPLLLVGLVFLGVARIRLRICRQHAAIYIHMLPIFLMAAAQRVLHVLLNREVVSWGCTCGTLFGEVGPIM